MPVIADATNPVTRLREGRGMTRRAFARHLGVAYTTLMHVELGYTIRIPPSLLTALGNAGFDAGQAQEEYIAWRNNGK